MAVHNFPETKLYKIIYWIFNIIVMTFKISKLIQLLHLYQGLFDDPFTKALP